MKALPVNPTDPAVTGPDIFAKLVPMAAHEASSLYRQVGVGGAGERPVSLARPRLGCLCKEGGSVSVQPRREMKLVGTGRWEKGGFVGKSMGLGGWSSPFSKEGGWLLGSGHGCGSMKAVLQTTQPQ